LITKVKLISYIPSCDVLYSLRKLSELYYLRPFLSFPYV
jgi:hypothetical protein